MKRKFLTILLVVLLTLSLVVGLVACVTVPDNVEYEDKGEFITNGNFTATSTTTDFPRSPSSWSGEAGSTATDNATETDSDALVSGIINTRDDFYKAYSNNWGKLKNPGKIGIDDDQILMIYNKKSTAYGYRSNTVSLKQNKYYKLRVSVRTDNISGAGAYVLITGDGGFNKEFAVGNTNGQWQTVTAYLETSKSSSTSLKLGLFNGKNGKNDGSLSKGYAFFDDAVIEEITSNEYNDASPSSTNEVKLSAAYGDTEFVNTSGTSNVYTAAAFTNSYSTGNNGSAPTGTDYLERGIVDVNNNPPSSLPANYDNELGETDGKFLFINNKELTAFGFRSNTSLRFERNSYYRIDIKLATFIDSATSSDTGANIRLMSSSSKDDTVAIIENIRTDSKWTTASFYVKGDSMRNKDLYIQFDLGSGGKDDNHILVKGQLMIDNFTVSASDEDMFNSKLASAGPLEAAYSLDTWAFDENANILADANKENASIWAEDSIAYNDFSPSGGTSANKGRIGYSNTGSWNDLLGSNPGSYKGNDNADVIAMINDTATVNYRAIYKDTANLKSTDGYYKIGANSYYRIGMWVKTRDIADNKGLSVSLMQYDDSTKKDPTTTEASRHSTLQTISNFNSASLENSDEYTELVFYVEGDLLKDKYVYLAFKLGNGSFLTPSTFVKGSAYISGITMYSVAFSDYSSETGDYVKQQSFKSSSGSITNGNFDSINNQTTLNYYESDTLKELDYSKGYLSNAFGVPSSWTNTNESTMKTQLNAGVFNLNATELQNMINAGKDAAIDFTDSFYQGFGDIYPNLTKQTNPNVLVIDTKAASDDHRFTTSTPIGICGCKNQACIDQGYCDGKASGCNTATEPCLHQAYNGRVAPFGFKSSSISLSANSYYMISVWAKASRGSGSIRLSTTNKENDQIITFDNTNASNWTRFDFYIETGFDSTTATLELFLGEAGTANEVSGTVFFDMPQLNSIDETTYEAAEKKHENAPTPTVKVLTYTVNSFDNATQNEDSLDTPTGWTGAQEDSENSPHETRDYVTGVYNFDHGNRDWLGKDSENTISAETMAQILSSSNPNALVINNNVATEYNYTYSLSKSLNTESYYKISIKVLTYNLSENAYAKISLKLNNLSYTFDNDSTKSIKVNHNLAWHEYSFYINTPTKTAISSTSLTVALGSKGNLVKGYAFFDDLTIAKIDKDEFDAAVPVDDDEKPAEGYNTADELRIVFTEDDVEATPPEEEDETDPLLWLYISSGILGGLIVLVMLVYLIKWLYTKYTRPWLEKRKRLNQRKNRTGDRNKNVYTPKNKDKFND